MSEFEAQSSQNWAIPQQMPPLPEHFVERPEPQNRVKEQLLCEGQKVFGTLVVSAIYGLGGIGKSVLASKLAHDDEVQMRFSDGILWSTLGQNPDILPLLSRWIQALGDHDYKPTAVEAASNHLRTLLYDKKALLVVDDVWNPAHLEPFRVGGDGCCVLVTTREAKIPEAHKYSLDVMSPEQALELMTQKLKEELSAEDRQQALDFADRVGYLPLALELAASQVENGETWSNLLANFQSEVVRLEALDVRSSIDMPDEAKRRHYSLTACFNLSLQRLSPGKLSQFAWLGVLPEDVPLTQDMATTLWKVPLKKAQDRLREFHEKAFLLIGSAQSSSNPQRVNYRMHDLMHDLSRQLLIGPKQPEQPGTLPGLGLTFQSAHRQLLSNYQSQTQQDQWHTLPNDGYIHGYLTWHMEQAGEIQAIHKLLKASNESGRNGWYEACDKLGKPALFLNDLGRAWRLAVENYDDAPEETLSLLWRYAMIRASLHSMASNMPITLLDALIKHSWWSAAQGLAYIQRVPEPKRCADYIAVIAPYLSKSLLPEAQKTIAQIKDSAYRSYALARLAQHFPALWPDVLDEIKTIQDGHTIIPRHPQGFFCRAFALKTITPLLPDDCLFQATKIAHQIDSKAGQALACTALAIRIPNLLSQAIGLIQTIEDKIEKSYVLRLLAKQQPAFLQQAFDAIRHITDDHERISALKAIRDQLPIELLAESLSLVTHIKGEYIQERTLQALLPKLPKNLHHKVFTLIQGFQKENSQASLLATLAEHCPLELCSEILAATEHFQDKKVKMRVLIALSQRLPEVLSLALTITQQLDYDHEQATALADLSRHAPELRPEAIRVARQLECQTTRVLKLADLSEQSPELFHEVINLVHQMPNAMDRLQPLQHLAKHHPQLISGILSLIPATGSLARGEFITLIVAEWLSPEVVSQLSPGILLEALASMHQDPDCPIKNINHLVQQMPAESLPAALNIVQQICDEEILVRAFCQLSQKMPELLSEALEIIRQLQSKDTQIFELQELSQQFPNILSETLAVIQEMPIDADRAWALCSLAKHNATILPQALAVTRSLQDKDEQARRLIALNEHFPETFSEALALIRSIHDEWSQVSHLHGLSKQVPAECLMDILSTAREIQDVSERSLILCRLTHQFPEIGLEALRVIRQIQDEHSRAIRLAQLSEHLPADLLPNVLELIRSLHQVSGQSQVFRMLCKQFPELLPEAWAIAHRMDWGFDRVTNLCTLAIEQPELLSELLTEIRNNRNESWQVLVFARVAKYLPSELLSEALSMVQEIRDETRRASAISYLMRYLPSDLLPEAMIVIRNIQSEAVRASAFRGIGESLPEPWLSKMAEIFWQIKAPYYRSHALLGLLPHIGQSNIEFVDWANYLDTLAYQKRETLLALLPDIRSIVLKLSNGQAFSDMLKTTRDIHVQWP